MASKDLPQSLQNMIKDILANDEAIKKVRQLDSSQKQAKSALPAMKSTPKCAKKSTTKQTSKKYEDEEQEEPANEEEEIVEEKPKKQKRLTKKDKQNNLSKQYLEEVAMGNLKFQDANGRSRTTSFKKWVNDTKNPKYDDKKECWSIPDTDMFKQRVLAMKTCGSLFMKTTQCSLTEMQSAVSYFLKALDEDQYENLSELLETPKIAPKIMELMSHFND